MSERSARRALDGAPNFRDLGGLPTLDGGRVRHGVLFRSGGLEELSTADVAYLVDELGLRTVFDLRSPDDRETAGPLAGTNVEVVSTPIVRDGSPTDVRRPMRPDGRVDVTLVYTMLLARSADSIATIVHRLVDGAAPVLFHCAAGKDRTGVLAAVLLEAVGVSREAVIEDFMRTGPALDDIIGYLSRRPAYADVVDRFPPGTLDAEPAYIADFLTLVDAEHGGIRQWLVDRAGLSLQTIEALTEVIVDPGRFADPRDRQEVRDP